MDVLPKKRADDPHKLPSMRCPSSHLRVPAVQPLQDALLRPGVPENTLGRGRPRQALQEDKEGGGAEQYHAETKHTEAVGVAAEACAEDTKGQTCYICTQALHWKTKEGLVRGCACRGTAGLRTCRAWRSRRRFCSRRPRRTIWIKVRMRGWNRWSACSLCEQDITASWRARSGGRAGRHTGAAGTDWTRSSAMTLAWEWFIRGQNTTRTHCP